MTIVTFLATWDLRPEELIFLKFCATFLLSEKEFYAPIAQLDRVLAFEARGSRFESWWAHFFVEKTAL